MSSTESATVTGRSHSTGCDTINDVKQDTRRYGTLVSGQIAEGISFIYSDDEDDDDSGNYTDFQSSWEFTPASPAPVACARKPNLSDTIQASEAQQLAKKYRERFTGITEAQRIVQDYHRKRDGIVEIEQSTVVSTSKELPTIPDHRDSTYTLAITDDGKSTIDLEKRPEPAIRLFHHDREGLAQAQHQGMEMIQVGHCTPAGNIRCQRPGCTDVLRDLEALKFHLHIHNIGDMSDIMSIMSTTSAHSQKTKEPRMEYPPLKKPSRKAHNRSKSSVEIGATLCQSQSTHRTRRSHAKDSSSLHGSRKTSPTHVNPSPPYTRTKVPPQSRGRRSNRGTIQNGLSEAGYNDSIAMVLSRPTSPVPSVQEVLDPNDSIAMVLSRPTSPVPSVQEVLDPKMNLPFGFVNSFSPPASLGRETKEFSRAKSPKRSFSPARALSPIRDGLRRVLSFGCLNDEKYN